MSGSADELIPDLSIVIPVVERHGDLVRLYEEYGSEARRLGRSAEFIFVIDHRQREVIPTLRSLQDRAPEDPCCGAASASLRP